jgi:DNA mismatch endonuclease, patch repair protein
MSDNHSKTIRSYNMSRIRSKDTRPELLVRSALFEKSFRYRLHDGKLPGKPDIVLPKYKSVIFINVVFGIAIRNVLKLFYQSPTLITGCQKLIRIF